MSYTLIALAIICGLTLAVTTIINIVLWVMMLIDIIKREDLKESKVLWLILWAIINGLAPIFFYYIEGPKKRGKLALIATIVPFVMIIIGGISLSIWSVQNFSANQGMIDSTYETYDAELETMLNTTSTFNVVPSF